MLGRGIARRVGLAIVITALTARSAAQAAFPGVNGKIAFERAPFQLEVVVITDSLRAQQAGERIALDSTPPQIFTMDPAGNGQANISNGTQPDQNPNWSPDGKLVTFWRTDSSSHNAQIWVMNADGSGQRKITDGPNDTGPAFSADGARIYFVRDSAIWVVGTDGSSPHALFTPPGGHLYFDPAASPDGSRIAFVDESGGSEQLVIANADGTGSPQGVANQGNTSFNLFPDWSPDGKQLVFEKDMELASQLFLIGADGSNPHALTESSLAHHDSRPHFSPDGQQVTFSRGPGLGIYEIQQNVQSNIWVIPSAGGTERQLTTQTDKLDFDPAWQPQSHLASIAQVPACTPSGAIPVAVTDDSGFKSRPSAVHFQIDGGAEQSTPTAGDPGTATITVPPGTHSLTFWGEDSAGYQEADHHTVSVLVDNTPPTLSLRIDQHRSAFTRGQKVTTTTVAEDTGSGLAVNPSRRHVRRSTRRVGVHTVRATAVDRCGNRRTRSVRYRVIAAVRKPKRQTRFTG